MALFQTYPNEVLFVNRPYGGQYYFTKAVFVFIECCQIIQSFLGHTPIKKEDTASRILRVWG